MNARAASFRLPALILAAAFAVISLPLAANAEAKSAATDGAPAKAPIAAKPAAPAVGAPAAAAVSPSLPSPAAPPAAPVATKPAAERFPKPEHVRGLYLTAWSAGNPKKMDKIFETLDKTELNSVVIDVMDSGQVYWKTGIKLAEETGSCPQVAVPKPDALFARLEQHKVYPIARISCFRNSFVPKKVLARAVQTADQKGAWHDASRHYWLDPFNKENWEYIAAVADFAMDQGFAEIQLDYVRFPSEGKRATMFFPAKAKWPTANPTDSEVIAEFARFIRERVKKRGLAFSADVFGIVSSGKSDQGIGQTLEVVAEPFDLICPMVYPSHFAKGEYGIKDPNRSPYEIICKSLRDYNRRIPGKHIRPWLQDFTLFGVPYGKREVELQIKASKEQGFEEYLLWNAGNKYTESAVVDTSGLADPKVIAENKAKLVAEVEERKIAAERKQKEAEAKAAAAASGAEAKPAEEPEKPASTEAKPAPKEGAAKKSKTSTKKTKSKKASVKPS